MGQQWAHSAALTPTRFHSASLSPEPGICVDLGHLASSGHPHNPHLKWWETQHGYQCVHSVVPALPALLLALLPDYLPWGPVATGGPSPDAEPKIFHILHQLPFIVLGTLLWSFSCVLLDLDHLSFSPNYIGSNNSLIRISHSGLASLVKPQLTQAPHLCNIPTCEWNTGTSKGIALWALSNLEWRKRIVKFTRI